MRDAAPIAFLVLLTPCVEFLTGSTSVGAVATVPAATFTFFVLTWPSYAFPVLLIREAVVVWNKWTASLLALGIAYGALNEGLLAKTYFAITATSPPLGGGAGRWFGVNWPWVTEITLFHMIVSISVPVVLSFLIFPETRHRRLLSDRSVRIFFALILAEVLGILVLESIFSAAVRGILPLMLLPIGVVVLGIYLARNLPRPDPSRILRGTAARPWALTLGSLVFFALTFTPVLWAFPVAFLPTNQLYQAFWQFGSASAIVAAIYPIGLAALAIRFLSRYSLSDRQLLALLIGVMLQPLATAISVHDIPSGDWAAAIAYIAAIVVAHRRIRARETVPSSPAVPSAAG